MENLTMNPQRVYRMARRLAYQMCLHECPDEVAKDLEQAAWLRFFERGEGKYLYKDLEWAMIEEVSRWLYQCRRGRGKDRLLKIKVELNGMNGSSRSFIDTLTPERILELKEQISGSPTATFKPTVVPHGSFFCSRCKGFFSKKNRARHEQTDLARKKERQTYSCFREDKRKSVTGDVEPLTPAD